MGQWVGQLVGTCATEYPIPSRKRHCAAMPSSKRGSLRLSRLQQRWVGQGQGRGGARGGVCMYIIMDTQFVAGEAEEDASWLPSTVGGCWGTCSWPYRWAGDRHH